MIAIKELFSSDPEDFEKEVTILIALGTKHQHQHLIKLLATYRHEEKYHLMFPYANANLRDYWDARPSPAFDQTTVLWSLRQMTGIANALQLIHNFTVTLPLSVPGEVRVQKDVELRVTKGEELFGRHGDIKPENILWFEKSPDTEDERGILQIADFGLGRFHGRDSRSNVPPESIFFSPTYEPPECKLRRPVSRAYDLWSLGCLYLEFITWLLMGSEAIEEFSDFRGQISNIGINDDNFFTIIKDAQDGTDAVVRKQVIEWVNRLHEHEKCSLLMHDILDLTMEQLLLINAKDRSKVIWLSHEMKNFLKKALESTEYMLDPIPWEKKSSQDVEQSTLTATTLTVPKAKSRNVSFSDTQLLNHKNLQRSWKSSTYVPKDLVRRRAGTPGLLMHSPIKPSATWPVQA